MSVSAVGDYRIAVDTGGTFTDVVLADAHGNLRLAKSATVLERASTALLGAVEELAEGEGIDGAELLGRTSTLVYGTTRATNAVVERKFPKLAFLTTRGFPDTLLLREGGKRGAFRRVPYPEPLVPRHRTFELHERMDLRGDAVVQLDEAQVVDVLETLRGRRIEAVGVCLLWAVANPAHELRVGELIEEHLPGVPYTLSHQVNPIIREYRRAASTVIDAGLKPLMAAHLSQLESDLRDAGFAGQLMSLTSFGGVWPLADLRDRPIYSVGSGPSVAPIGAITCRDSDQQLLDHRELIICDTGGTTFDVSVVRGTTIEHTSETWLGEPGSSDMLGINAVDVHSIGAGGGSIASVDPDGLLMVGPESAGAFPGPACYGNGGTRPTVTDAAVLLGYLDPHAFLGGRLTLDRAAAEQAMDAFVAAPLGLSTLDAASAVMRVAAENSVSAIKDITVARGYDPRQATIVAGGGAAGMSIAEIAQALHCPRVLIPRLASGLSASGAHFCDLISDFSTNVYAETRNLDPAEIDRQLDDIERRAVEYLDGLVDVAVVSRRLTFIVEARYPRQAWELPIVLPAERLADRDGVAALEAAFHAEHQRVFGVQDPGQYLECIRWSVRARAVVEKPPLAAGSTPAGSAADAGGHEAHFAGRGLIPTARADIESLPPGTPVPGPAVLTSPTTTVVAPPGWQVERTTGGNLLLTLTA